jgi:3-deoxy-D-manno-octulosonic-acid transferase
MFLLYNLFLFLTVPIWLPWAWFRASRRKEAPNWKERCGNYQSILIPKEKPSVWVHAVSVGEVMAAVPILRQLRALCPEHAIVLSVTTSSGHRTASEFGVDLYDHLVYFPLDVARFQLSAMMRVKPDVVVIMETELWFNFLWAAKTIGAKTMLVNGRISDRSFPRSQKIRFFYAALLGMMDRCLMQTDLDRERILALGAKSAETFGNVKFDEAVDGLGADPEWWRETLGLAEGMPVLMIGSSRGEEEERLIRDALRRVEGSYSLVWAPRHLERADAIAADLTEQFGGVARRSLAERGNVILLDTYGELGKAYAVADIVIIGGGFSNLGGQNLLQPLAHGKPVLHGPHMQNFREIAEGAAKAGATESCVDADALARALQRLLNDPAERAQRGVAGKAFVHQHEGASRRYAVAIQDAMRT